VRTHPAEKPVGLLQDLIRTCGDHIIDPFMGSASTGVACIRSKRKFTGIEIEERYFDIACRRIQDAVDRPDLFLSQRDPEPVQQPLFGGEAA
jgi:DNA modification methylase